MKYFDWPRYQQFDQNAMFKRSLVLLEQFHRTDVSTSDSITEEHLLMLPVLVAVYPMTANHVGLPYSCLAC